MRDKQGRKMSKQLGNSPDALKLIDDFGADAVRVGLMLSSAAGNDLLFDESLCQQGKNFSNKIWNAYRLIEGWEVDENRNQSAVSKEALHWYTQKFQQALEQINDNFDKYRISDAMMTSYKLIWDDFCSWLLEAIKPAYGDPIDGQTYREVRVLFEDNLKLLHPFMPFLTCIKTLEFFIEYVGVTKVNTNIGMSRKSNPMKFGRLLILSIFNLRDNTVL